MTSLETRTLDVPGARLAYDIRGDLATATSAVLALLVIGSPMPADGFGTLTGHLSDRPVVTYDPRGAGRSTRTDGAAEVTPAEHSDDLHRIIAALNVGKVDMFASSGGAVNALALVAAWPADVRVLVAHEPPAVGVLPDRDQLLAVCEDIYQTYHRTGLGPAMAKFIALTSQQGELPADYLDQPAPDPATFGLPAEDDGARDNPLLGQNLRTCTGFRPDVDALATAVTRVVLAAGTMSAGTLAARAAAAIANQLGAEPAEFPGDHVGFLGDEYGMPGEPEAFAARLLAVLASSGH